jgi:hypothetical protein
MTDFDATTDGGGGLLLEQLLAKQANAAMAAGANPQTVSNRLTQLIRHARANPQLRQDAESALAAGADPHAVSDRYAQLAMESPAPAPLSAQERAARARQRQNINEQEAAALPSPLEAGAQSVGQGLTTLASGLPGGKMAIAGLRSVTSSETLPEAMRNVQQDVAEYSKENPKSAFALQVLGSAPTWGATKAAGAALQGVSKLPVMARNIPTLAKLIPGIGVGAGTGAAYSALDAAPLEGNTLGERAANYAGRIGTGMGFGAIGGLAPEALRYGPVRALAGGALGAAVAPKGYKGEGALAGATVGAFPSQSARLASKGLSALADRVRGVPALSQAASALENIGQATGKRGAINAAMQQVQDVLTPLKQIVGAKSRTAQETINLANSFYDKSNELFAKAKADSRMLTSAAVREHLADPDIVGAFNATEAIRAAEKRPLPQAVTGQVSVPSPSGLLDASGQPMMVTKDVVESLPDPSALHMVKRIVRDIVDGKESRNVPITLAEAKRIEPKLKALTETLHTESPDFRRADAFFEAGKTAEEAAQLGYGAAKPGMQNPEAGALTSGTPAAVKEYIATRRTPRLQQIAQGAAQRGARGQLTQAAATPELSEGVAGVMNQPAMVGSPAAAEQRTMALGPQASKYEQALAQARTQAETGQPLVAQLSHLMPRRANMAARAFASPDVLQSKYAKTYLADILSNPQAYQQTLQQSAQGRQTLSMLSQLFGAQLARP